MFQKELILLVGVAVAVVVMVVGIASLAVRAVQHDASMVVLDTLPGLVSAGEAMERLNENWFTAHLLLETGTPAERARLISNIDSNSTAELWRRYGESIYDSRDAQLFRDMENARAEFMSARSNYFHLVQSGRITEARDFFKSPLAAGFKKYREAAGSIFILNAEVGQQRADRIIRLSRWTPYVLGGLCVIILLTGVFIGFKASLGAFSRPWNDSADRGT